METRFYRVTHLVGNSLPLTHVWEVPTAGGSYILGKMADLSKREVATNEMGHPVP